MTTENNKASEDNVQQTDDDNDDSIPDISEEIIRVVTKDGVEYLLTARLPPPKGFVIEESTGNPLVWNPVALRMVVWKPEPVTIKNIDLWKSPDGSSVFRIACVADKDSDYEKQGLTIVRTISKEEVSTWDSVTNQEAMLIAINEARMMRYYDDDDDDNDEDSNENTDNSSDNPTSVIPVNPTSTPVTTGVSK